MDAMAFYFTAIHIIRKSRGQLNSHVGSLITCQGTSTGQPVTTKAFIEGPYGSSAADIYGGRHTMFLLISGGIGVTPMQSVMNDLISQQQRGRVIDFLW